MYSAERLSGPVSKEHPAPVIYEQRRDARIAAPLFADECGNLVDDGGGCAMGYEAMEGLRKIIIERRLPGLTDERLLAELRMLSSSCLGNNAATTRVLPTKALNVISGIWPSS